MSPGFKHWGFLSFKKKKEHILAFLPTSKQPVGVSGAAMKTWTHISLHMPIVLMEHQAKYHSQKLQLDLCRGGRVLFSSCTIQPHLFYSFLCMKLSCPVYTGYCVSGLICLQVTWLAKRYVQNIDYCKILYIYLEYFWKPVFTGHTESDGGKKRDRQTKMEGKMRQKGSYSGQHLWNRWKQKGKQTNRKSIKRNQEK